MRIIRVPYSLRVLNYEYREWKRKKIAKPIFFCYDSFLTCGISLMVE